ncbi:MAG: pyrroloquinoline quinone precursor peptide PqqA [Beijerinckiaceae bacterium]|jgi:coenzyme PQQ precursor peptide PqqA|nr:pyrroloquinoline quinone precursor peptide PqqA [Beijerinckiaceae bacterium]MDR3539442.1 pyrroloquinoline quinone precursor peptide PqqA [Desulfosporosinus sp.]
MEMDMNWVAPIVEEICVGMEVTSYESAEVEF